MLTNVIVMLFLVFLMCRFIMMFILNLWRKLREIIGFTVRAMFLKLPCILLMQIGVLKWLGVHSCPSAVSLKTFFFHNSKSSVTLPTQYPRFIAQRLK